MNIVEITDDLEKKSISQNILKALPEWFGIPESMEEYIQDSAGKPFFCARINEKNIGFLYLKQTGNDTVELAVMGVLKEYHRNGIGHALFEYAFLNSVFSCILPLHTHMLLHVILIDTHALRLRPVFL